VCGVRGSCERWLTVRLVLVKVHFPSCVVLVINDNPYGLIFSLSLI
jgi:hypothetical protein